MRQRGFTLFELAVAASVLAVLVALLTNRVLFYQEQAEIVAAEQLIGTLRSALQFKNAQLRITQRTAALSTLAEENPIGWLSEKPSNYLGEYYAPELENIPPGNWYFDRADKTLVYVLSNSWSFAAKPPNLLKFKVKLPRLPTAPAKPSGSPVLIEGAVLDQVVDRTAAANVGLR
ncbi:MAG TPA: type II secretion system protein [Telluria sp.]|nr:type II secretion system protein [Telluria sp.]